MKIATIRWFESQESYTWISVAVARTSGDDGTTPGKLHTACMGMGQKSVVSIPGLLTSQPFHWGVPFCHVFLCGTDHSNYLIRFSESGVGTAQNGMQYC